MARIDARDTVAMGELYDRHACKLLGLARRILGDSGEAEEVLQEVFLHAWRAASSFDLSRGRVLTWLRVATRSRSIDRIRSRRSASHPDTQSFEECVAEHVSQDDVEAGSEARKWEAICRAAVFTLPADQRRVLELAFFEGLTQNEVALMTATPLGTVKTRARLGLMKIREHVRPYLFPENRGRLGSRPTLRSSATGT